MATVFLYGKLLYKLDKASWTHCIFGTTVLYPATRYPTAQQLNAASAAAHGYPAGYTSGGGGYPGGSGLYPAGYGGKTGLAQQQPNSTYHEDVSFPRQVS